MEMDREMEEAATSLGAGGFTVFRRIIFPNLLPGLLAGVALAFARALGEFGSLILISGNIPFKTEVSSVFIRSQIESGNVSGAAAVSVVLLGDLAAAARRSSASESSAGQPANAAGQADPSTIATGRRRPHDQVRDGRGACASLASATSPCCCWPRW